MTIFPYDYKNHLNKDLQKHLHNSEVYILRLFESNFVRLVFPDPIFPEMLFSLFYFGLEDKNFFFKEQRRII